MGVGMYGKREGEGERGEGGEREEGGKGGERGGGREGDRETGRTECEGWRTHTAQRNKTGRRVYHTHTHNKVTEQRPTHVRS